METVKESIILCKTSKPLHKGQLFGVMANGGEINIDDKFGVRFSRVSDIFWHCKLIVYGEKPSYKVNKFVKVIKQIQKVKAIKEDKKEFEMIVNEGGDLFDEL